MYKKLLFLGVVCFITTIHLKAQTPAFISYQAVACDSDGNELISQKISIRATIFEGGPNGNLTFQEVHSNATLTTDEFGLFTIEVGNGAIQAGSPANSLNQIDWSTGDYWLRVEMDPLGGVNFKLVGANRLLSVPYALYAEKARKATLADVAVTAQNADTAFYVAPSTYIVNAINATYSTNSDTSIYTSVAGNAITANFATKSDTAQFAFNAGNANFAVDAENAVHAEQSDTAQYAFNAGNAQSAAEAAHAVNADNAINATNAQNAVEAEHAVNSDTAQYAYNAGHSVLADDATNAVSAQSALTALDDNDKDPTNEMQALTYDTSGVLRIVPASQGVTSVTLQSAQNFSSPASSMSFPEGIKGDYLVIPDQYTVPVGKHLYLTAAGGTVGLPVYQVDHPTAPTMPTFPESTIITNCKCTGLLVDATTAVDVELLNFNNFQNNEYTVPAGKIFMLKSGLPTNDSRLQIKAPGANSFVLFDIGTSPNQAAIRMPIFPEGTVIRKPASLQTLIVSGLLIDTF